MSVARPAHLDRHYYPVPQCTAASSLDGLYGVLPFGGLPYAGGARRIAVPNSRCCATIPSTANPHGYGPTYVTLYPTECIHVERLPKQVVTYSAIVPAGPNGSVDVLTNGSPTDIQLRSAATFGGKSWGSGER